MPLLQSLEDDRVKKLKSLKYPSGQAPYVQKDILTDYNEIEGAFMPSYSEQIGDNEVMLYVLGKKRKKKALFITFD